MDRCIIKRQILPISEKHLTHVLSYHIIGYAQGVLWPQCYDVPAEKTLRALLGIILSTLCLGHLAITGKCFVYPLLDQLVTPVQEVLTNSLFKGFKFLIRRIGPQQLMQKLN